MPRGHLQMLPRHLRPINRSEIITDVNVLRDQARGHLQFNRNDPNGQNGEDHDSHNTHTYTKLRDYKITYQVRSLSLQTPRFLLRCSPARPLLQSWRQ